MFLCPSIYDAAAAANEIESTTALCWATCGKSTAPPSWWVMKFHLPRFQTNLFRISFSGAVVPCSRFHIFFTVASNFQSNASRHMCSRTYMVSFNLALFFAAFSSSFPFASAPMVRFCIDKIYYWHTRARLLAIYVWFVCRSHTTIFDVV